MGKSHEAVEEECEVRTFTYATLPKVCVDWDMRTKKESDAFGNFGHTLANHSWLRTTDNNALGAIVQHRLLHSRCTTTDPARADLFFVPALLRPKNFREFNAACAKCNAKVLRAGLPHLNETTASRHFAVFSKEHFAMKGCDWWYEPTGVFAQINRVATNAQLPDTPSMHRSVDYMTGWHKELFDVNNTIFPHFFGTIMPSNVHIDPHAEYTPPWAMSPKATGRGSYLMSYLGSTGTYNHGDVAVRAKIQQQCKHFGPHVCHVDMYFRVTQLLIKQRATFCLEAAGDTPFRRSIVDDLTLGCIPVLFSEAMETTAPFSWAGWREDSRVHVDRDAFLAGSVNLHELLRNISNEHVASMQAAIAANGRKFQLSLRDDSGDALGVLLKGIATTRGLLPRS